MASSVYLLNHGTLSIPPFRVPSTVTAARTTRSSLMLRHASIHSLPMSSSGRPVRRLLTPVVCAVDGAPPPPPPPPPPPTPTPIPTTPRNNKGDGNIVTWAVMALAGALGALGSSFMSNQKISITFMKGSSRHKNIDQPAAKVNELLMKLMDGEKGKKEVPLKLKGMFETNPDEAYFVGMGLIKILVSRENFTDAVTIGALLEDFYCKSNSPLLKKGDLFLYMVLIHGMVGEAGGAELSWNKFKSLTEESTTINPQSPPSSKG